MNISKIVGIVGDHKRDDSGRIKVISFKRNGETITKSSEIKLQFPPDGFVFAPKFFERFNHKLHSLVEFSINNALARVQKGDSILMDIDKECKSVGFKVFKIDYDILTDDLAINQPILKNYVEADISQFYIAHKKYLFGLFKSINGEVIPKVGKEVNKYELNESKLISFQHSFYLLEQPTAAINRIDCMTQAQLSEWFKDQIKNLKLNIDLATLKKALESQSFDDLDNVRLKRAIKILNQLALNHSELKLLADSSVDFSKQYNDAIEKIKEEITSEHVSPFLIEKDNVKRELEKLEKNLKTVRSERDDVTTNLKSLKEEYCTILQEKERLIQDIRIHSRVMNLESNSERKVNYEEQSYKTIAEKFATLSEFIQAFNETVEVDKGIDQRIGNQFLFKFKEYKCFLTEDVNLILQVAKVSNNCKVIIQQVEPDWLKFDFLSANGLSKIWSLAEQNPETLHFLILEDINLASIECYGRPLLDVLSGIRKGIPGKSSGFPKNLWVFGIPLNEVIDGEFGLPLIGATYANWGFFPKFKGRVKFRENNYEKVLRIEDLLDHEIITSNSSTEYFPEK
jgi:hypothetical protein